MATSFLSNLRLSMQRHATLSWILVSTLGYYIVNINYLGQYLLKTPIHANFIGLVYFLVISPVVSGLVFGLIQLGYMKIINRGFFIRRWVLLTSISIFLINLINAYLYGFINLAIFEITNIDIPVSGNVFTGYVIGGEMDLFIKILISALLGTFLGLVSGLALGLFPSFSILNKEIKKEWGRRVLVALCLSFVVNSIFYTVSYDIHLLGGRLGSLYHIGFLFTGFMYGVFTRNTIKKLLASGSVPIAAENVTLADDPTNSH